MKKIFIIVIAVAVVGAALLLLVSKKTDNNEPNRPVVVASFYPYYFIAKEIMGTRGSVYNITPSGSEPHDYDLSTGDRILLEKSNLVILNGAGMEPWAGNAEAILGTKVFKVGERFVLDRDPHVWLDPAIMIQITNEIAERLIEIDPNATNHYRANSSNLVAKLYALDLEFTEGLKACEKKDIITAHEAFSYPARRYGFNQISIVGISPEAEPGAKDLAIVTNLAREKGIKIIFFESLVGPKLANTIAKEVGAETSVLNPLEGLSDMEVSEGKNYFTEMKINLENLRTAMVCQ